MTLTTTTIEEMEEKAVGVRRCASMFKEDTARHPDHSSQEDQVRGTRSRISRCVSRMISVTESIREETSSSGCCADSRAG